MLCVSFTRNHNRNIHLHNMQYTIKAPLTLQADITLPASKSISNRALVISALAARQGAPAANGDNLILPDNLSQCDDTDVMVAALHDMPDTIDIKAAGTAMRFMTAYLSVTPGTHVITGTERMQHRPIRILVDALRSLGADIEYVCEEGYPPLRITGKQLTADSVTIDGNVSSQYISALLMIGPVLQNGLTLSLRGDIVSRPYIDLTLNMMRDYGAEVEWSGVDTITVMPTSYRSRHYFVESDWSAASYWYQLMALYCDNDSDLRLHGLMRGSRQGDSRCEYIFSLLGVNTTYDTEEELTPTTVTLSYKAEHLSRLDFDFTHQPDLAQTMIATCLAAGIQFHFRGLASLKIKETDRIEAMKAEMRRLGFVIYDYNDSELRWDGERCQPEPDALVQTYDDHRMAMSIAPMSVILRDLRINHPSVVSKSYPQFWEHLRSAGFIITEE